jgi:cytoskeletal protein CcmA (bactofilin family)
MTDFEKEGFNLIHRLAMAAFLFLVPGCSDSPAAQLVDSGPGPADAGSDIHTGLGDDTIEEYCEGEGPPIIIEAQAGNDEGECTGDIAEELFRFAICTCKDATVMGVLRTDSFDSALGPFDVPDDSGGAVGINRNMGMPGDIGIGGTTIVAGSNGVVLPGVTNINGDFKVQGSLKFAGTLAVARDLLVGGRLTNFGDANVGRDLYLGGAMVIPGLTNPNGNIIHGPVTVDPPCQCAADQVLDIPSIVTDAKTNNHNADADLDQDSLKVIIGHVELDLPCGRFYLTSVGGAGKLTITVQGRTALFVDGDFNLTGDLELDIGDEGELDVFVSGNLTLTGANDFGQQTRPSAVRFYVAGSKDVTITGATGFVGNLYAPQAKVVITGAADIYGSIFAGDFLSMGDTGIHYDRDILTVGEDCDDTPEDENECVPAGEYCDVDADCCEPFVCKDGKCIPLIAI